MGINDSWDFGTCCTTCDDQRVANECAHDDLRAAEEEFMRNLNEELAQALIDNPDIEVDVPEKQPDPRDVNATMRAALRERWERAKANGFRGWFLPPGV